MEAGFMTVLVLVSLWLVIGSKPKEVVKRKHKRDGTWTRKQLEESGYYKKWGIK